MVLRDQSACERSVRVINPRGLHGDLLMAQYHASISDGLSSTWFQTLHTHWALRGWSRPISGWRFADIFVMGVNQIIIDSNRPRSLARAFVFASRQVMAWSSGEKTPKRFECIASEYSWPMRGKRGKWRGGTELQSRGRWGVAYSLQADRPFVV